MSNFHNDEIIFISDEEEFMPASQATMPPSSQPLVSDMDDVLEITDGEDEEALDSHRPSSSRASEGRYSPLPPSSPPTEAAYLSDSDIEIDDTAALNLYATRAPLTRTNSAASSSRILNLLDATSLSDDDDEFPLAASLSQPRSSPSKRSRNEANMESDDDASTGSPPKKARASASASASVSGKSTRRSRKTSEEKEMLQAAKASAAEKRKAVTEEKKRQKVQEKEENAARKAEEQARKEQEKKSKAQLKKANVLVNNKKSVLRDVTIILSHSFVKGHSELNNTIHDVMLEHETLIDYQESLLEGFDTVRWKTTWEKEYNMETRSFVPREKFEKEEPYALLYISATCLAENIQRGRLETLVGDFRRTHRLTGLHDQTHILYYGLGKQKESMRDKILEALIELQYTSKAPIHLHKVDGVEKIATRLYDLSGDIAHKTYKLITRSYLPFCADDKVEKGKTTVDIYQKMLDEIPHVTLPYAKSISKTHATLADLFTAYEAEPRGDKRDRMLIGLPVNERVNGTRTTNNRNIGLDVSARIHSVLCGQDPLELVQIS